MSYTQQELCKEFEISHGTLNRLSDKFGLGTKQGKFRYYSEAEHLSLSMQLEFDRTRAYNAVLELLKRFPDGITIQDIHNRLRKSNAYNNVTIDRAIQELTLNDANVWERSEPVLPDKRSWSNLPVHKLAEKRWRQEYMNSILCYDLEE